MIEKALCPIFSKEMDNLYFDLTLEKEIELVTRAKAGDVKARNKLLESQLKQITSVARSYANNLNSVTELVSEAVIGFDHAINKFDFSKGNRFVTYYSWWVRNAINLAVHSNHTIRPPMNIAKTNSKTDEELAKMKGNKRKVGDKVHTGFSMNAPVGDDGKTTFEDTFRSSDCTETEVHNKLTIRKALRGLDRNSREWKIIKYHFIDNMTLEDIGGIIGISKQAISVIMKKTLTRLRARITEY